MSAQIRVVLHIWLFVYVGQIPLLPCVLWQAHSEVCRINLQPKIRSQITFFEEHQTIFILKLTWCGNKNK